MSDYSAVAPPTQNCSQSTAFAAALQRAKQIAAKINPATVNSTDNRQKRPLEEGPESDAKKGPGSLSQGQNLGLPLGNRPLNQANMGGPAPGLGGATHNEDIKVPDKMVGLIIGRGGEQISRLQSESGCKIQMAPDSQGAPDRICSLSGTKDAIDRAKELINNIIHQRGLDQGEGRGPPLMGADHNDFSGMNNMNQSMGGPGGLGMGGGRNFVEIMIPGPKVGLIIGKGGETIKQLQEKSGAKMVVIQDGPNQEHEKPLRISGDAPKVEYAKQLVYDLIAEKEMQNFGRGGGRRSDDFTDGFARGNGGGGGGGGANGFEVSVPRAAVGVVIGKGGDMIKKIQAETGARVQFQQAREEGPGERSCFLQGTPKQVEQARQRIEELIESVQRRDNDGPNRRGGRGREGFDNRGGNRNGNGEFAGWDERRNNLSQDAEVTFSVPANKCGIIIGRGGDTIKQINSQSGAHCELDRRSQNQNSSEKMFFIRGDPDAIEAAKRIIQDKIQMQISFVNSAGPPSMSNSIPTAYPGMATQGYNLNPQGWGVAGYQQQTQQAASNQQWGTPNQGADQNAGQAAASGQADYSLQWAEYYRSMGMHREADMIEQQAKNKAAGQPVQTAPVVANPATSAPSAPTNGQQDYSAQWAEYYRSMGKVKEAEAIEAQIKNKTPAGGIQAMGQTSASQVTGQPPAGNYSQQSYAAYQQAGYYGAQPSQAVQNNVSQSGYGFPSYGYGGPNGGTGQSGQDN